MQQRQRVDADDARRILLDVADADDRGQHVDVRPLAPQPGQRVRPREITREARDVGAGAQGRQHGVVPAAREVVHQGQLVPLVGEALREMAADEPRAAEDQRARHGAHAYPIAA